MRKRLAQFIKQKPPAQPDGLDIIQRKGDQVSAVFMHIHKCAGTSLINTIAGSDRIISCAARPGNFTAKTGRNLIPDALWEKCFKFTFIRNPFDRVYSAYCMFKTYPCFKPLFPSLLDFLQFLEWTDLQQHEVNYQMDEPAYALKLENIIHHCSSYLNPKYHIREMNFIGRLESLETDLQTLESRSGIALPLPPRLNPSRREADYRKVYGAAERGLAEKIYAADLAAFPYDF